MDPTRYRVREFLDRDFPTLTAISHRLEPERKHSEQEVRHQDEVLRGLLPVYHSVVAEDRSTGIGVGFGELATDPDTLDPRYPWVDVTVDPDHQRRGIGRHLADVIEAEGQRVGALTLWASARADRPRDGSFAKHRGFVERRHQWQSRLILPAPSYASIPRRAEALAREGIEFTTLAQEGPDRPAVRERLHRLFNAVLEDEPRMGTYAPSTFEQFVSLNFGRSGFLPEAYFLARKDGQYVGISNLELLAEEPGVLHQVLTGTLREFRGRGIATELKRRTVEYGQTHGFRSIRTNNDSLNHPMWAINQKLGFARELEHTHYEKSLGGPTTGGPRGVAQTSPAER